VKCGKQVERETGIEFIDLVLKIHPNLVRNLGSIAGNIVAGALLLILVIALIALHVLIRWILR